MEIQLKERKNEWEKGACNLGGISYKSDRSAHLTLGVIIVLVASAMFSFTMSTVIAIKKGRHL